MPNSFTLRRQGDLGLVAYLEVLAASCWRMHVILSEKNNLRKEPNLLRLGLTDWKTSVELS